MNVGVDFSVSYFEGTSGTLIDLGDVQTVHIVPLKHDIKSSPYNNDPRYGYVPDGFKIDFTITRTLSLLEDFMVLLAANFSQGILIAPGYLNESIINTDGTVVRYQYQRFVSFMVDLGDVSRDKVVTQRLEGMASSKIKIA